jgi:predicted Rossmann-fold nucleotide-binding protein
MPKVAFLGKPITNDNSNGYVEVKKIAEFLAKANWSIVCSNDKLMETSLSEIVANYNIEFFIVSTTNLSLDKKEIGCQIIKVDNQVDKIKTIIEISDLIIIFPGGTETLFELSTIWLMLEQNMIYRKIIITISDMWDEIVQLVSFYDEQAYESGLLMKNAKNADEAITFIKEYIPFD